MVDVGSKHEKKELKSQVYIIAEEKIHDLIKLKECLKHKNRQIDILSHDY